MRSILVLVVVLFLTQTAQATDFTLQLTSGIGIFSDLKGFTGSTDNGYTIVADGLTGFFGSGFISGPAALTELRGFGEQGECFLDTPTGSFIYSNSPPNFPLERMSVPTVIITDAGVPADGQTHTVPFHVTVDVFGVGLANDSYHFFGDGLMTVTEFGPNPHRLV